MPVAHLPAPTGSAHVLTEDTVARRLEGGCLRSKRVVTKTNRMPKWGERFLSARTVAVLEESACEPARRSMVTLTRNLAHTHLMEVTERVEYVPHPDDPQHKTLVRRCAWVGSRVFGFGYAIQVRAGGLRGEGGARVLSGVFHQQWFYRLPLADS